MPRGDAQDLAQDGEAVVFGVGGSGGGGRAGGRAGRGQAQVQQDAVHVGREQPRGLGEVAGAAQTDAVAVGVEDLGDGESARRVVLYHQQGE